MGYQGRSDSGLIRQSAGWGAVLAEAPPTAPAISTQSDINSSTRISGYVDKIAGEADICANGRQAAAGGIEESSTNCYGSSGICVYFDSLTCHPLKIGGGGALHDWGQVVGCQATRYLR